MTIYCGREFGPADIQTIKRLMEDDPRLKRSPLSRKLCELFEWRKPNGELKDMTCRVALLRMQTDGLITLPPSDQRSMSLLGKPHFPPTPATDPQPALLLPVHELGPLTLCPVTTPASSRMWNSTWRVITIWATRRCRVARCVGTSSPASSSLHC